MKYRYKLDADRGITLYKGKLSVLLQAISYGRSRNDNQLRIYVDATQNLLDGVAGIEVASAQIAPAVMRDSFVSPTDNLFWKYVSPDTLEHIKKGSLQVGTASYYRSCENPEIRDHREGCSTFHIGCGNDQPHASVVSGFNCLILCGTTPGNPDIELMSKRFGERRIQIRDVRAFCVAKVAALSTNAA